METKKVYQFDDKKIYKGTLTLDTSDKSASGNWNIPSDCVEIAPPAPQENTAYKWQGGVWVAVEDYRKKEYWLPGDTYGTPGREVKEIGPLPEGATLTPPEQTLEDVKTAKVAEMKAERDKREQGVITYNGKGFDYDLKSVAKLNEARDVLLVDGGVLCRVPVRQVKKMGADVVVAVDVLGKVRPVEKVPNVISLIMRTYDVMDAAKTATQKRSARKYCDLWLEPDMGDISQYRIRFDQSVYDAGYYCGMNNAEKIKNQALYYFEREIPKPAPGVQPLVIRVNRGDEVEVHFSHSLDRERLLHRGRGAGFPASLLRGGALLPSGAQRHGSGCGSSH